MGQGRWSYQLSLHAYSDPDYLEYASGIQGYNYVYGTEFYVAAGQSFHVQPDVYVVSGPQTLSPFLFSYLTFVGGKAAGD